MVGLREGSTVKFLSAFFFPFLLVCCVYCFVRVSCVFVCGMCRKLVHRGWLGCFAKVYGDLMSATKTG